MDAPQFGGGSGPPDVIPLPMTSEQSEPSALYDVVDVFYGTDRALTGSSLPSRFYGSAESELSLGICKVSIPKARQHEIGEIEEPSWLKLEFHEDPSKHVVLLAVSPQPESDFVSSLRASTQAARGRQVLLFVHGYRMSFEDAARRTAQLAYDLKIGVPALYSWPTRGTFFGYGTDIRSAGASVPNLLRFLQLIAVESEATAIHLIAHSMGNLALTQALQDFPNPARKGGPLIREVILAAPDIDARIFREQIAPKILRPPTGPRFTLYTSHNDYALFCARVFRSGYVRAGDYCDGLPIVVPGIETIDVSAVNTSFLGWLTSHSYVGDRPPVLRDIFDVFKGTPPDKRFGIERRADRAGTPYWVFRPENC
jgi:esterase/lipase superfamily enzyme